MIRVRGIKLLIEEDNEDNLLKKVFKKLRINNIDSYKIVKKSIDARDKNNIYYVYELDIDTKDKVRIDNKDIFNTPNEEYEYSITGTNRLNNRPIIIGSGPAGLFCGYMLSEAGYSPLIIEQGSPIEKRVKDVEEFFKTNKLNVLSNIQFGEGGAGTFSDGKLNTLVKDKKFIGKKVFEVFIENGAPSEILYLNKPHIGTDVLRKVIVNMRNKIISMGGEFRFNTKLTDINIVDNRVSSIIVNSNEEIMCDVLVLAIGHSSRDTFKMLYEKGLSMKSKNFAVGFRIEHNQDMINKSQYGSKYKLLPPADYKLTHQSSNGRGVYSFCMCPGGFVVNASSEDGYLAVNGMSNYKRDERNSNSAIVVTITNKDFGDGVLDGVEFQRKIEKEAYSLGSGLIPVQKYIDFKSNVSSESLGEVIPNTKGDYKLSNLRGIFSEDINSSLIEGIESFGNKIKGFNRDDSILLGVESRTSSPVIIERDDSFNSSVIGIYPCGEGAGYAGGITTASIDGIKVFEKIIEKYKN